MKHSYELTPNNDILVDGNDIIECPNSIVDYYQRERWALETIDYILENEDKYLSEYLNRKKGV